MSVDPGALAEALAYEDGENVYLPGDTLAIISEAARAVLEAPTAEWCETHGLPVRARYANDRLSERECEDAPYTDTHCEVGRVRLVPTLPSE